MTENRTPNQSGMLTKVAKKTDASKAMTEAKKLTFSALINSESTQKAIFNTLQDAERTKTFTSSLVSAVSTNPMLRDCDGISIISAALLGEALELSPSPQLGHYYIVPYEDNKSKTKKAQFQIGWKGYWQLALRCPYKHINAEVVKKGELVSFNPFTEEISLKPIEDPDERDDAETIGYYAFFELPNGFRKEIYWSKKKMESHALKYSKAYRAKKGYSFWEKDFDAMALKTMYRQLIGKYGIMSIQMQKAFVNDMSVHDSLEADASAEYPDGVDLSTGEVIDAEVIGEAES